MTQPGEPYRVAADTVRNFDVRLWGGALRHSLAWVGHYKREYLPSDTIAGLTVAIMLIPQSMAYAALAGLDPIVGLYASIVPVFVYGLLGSTGIMTLGPTAITSVMTLSVIAPLAADRPDAAPAFALTLALLLGGVYIMMGLFRLGFLVNLLSQPVLIGYVNAAAIIIAVSQLQHLLGVSFDSSPLPHILLWRTLRALPQTNPATLLTGVGAIGLLLAVRHRLDPLLARLKMGAMARFTLTRSGPLLAALLGTLLVYLLQLDTIADVAVVGAIPRGLPALTFGFDWTHWQTLLLGAVAIAFVGFMEDISTARSLLDQRNQTLNSNQELLAMGAANIGAALTGGLPVTTSISRSAVNHAAGAKTGLASMIAAGVLLLTVLFLTPVFYYLPRSVLAAIILTSVVNLIRPGAFVHLWRYSHTETAIALVTVIGVFFFNIQFGILTGVALMVALYIYRSARPPIVELGRCGYSTQYDDVRHEDVVQIPHVLILKIDESLYFANAQYLDQYLRDVVAQRDGLTDLVLECSAINTIDASAAQLLVALVQDFRNVNLNVYIVGLKSRVYSKLAVGDLQSRMGDGHFFKTTHEAILATKQLIDDELPI
jgi:sulfate permease, SulP family